MYDALRRVDVGWGQPRDDCMIEGSLSEAAVQSDSAASLRDVAVARVLHGAALERHAAHTCSQLWPVSRVDMPEDPASRRRACQLYFDAYCCAVWTSAHAEYVAACDAGAVDPPEPTIGTFPCASSGIDLSDLFSRRAATNNDAAYPKTAEPLIQLMARATNPGSRGWDTVLKASLGDAGARSVVTHALSVCLTGMHPQLHPATRPEWKTRMMTLRLASFATPHLVAASAHVKEAMRRSIASIMAVTPAAHAAMASLGHPVRHLHQPPVQFPHAGMEGAMAAFVDAGVTISHTPNPGSMSVVLAAAFRGRQAEQSTDAGDDLRQEIWDPSWLGTLALPTDPYWPAHLRSTSRVR